MQGLEQFGEAVKTRRRALDLSQRDLSTKAHVSRATLDALENHRTGEIGFSKLTRILAALGLELNLQEIRSPRPTMDDLLNENADDQSLDRRR